MKRFWKEAAAAPDAEGGHAILLDGRPVRTPLRASLAVPSAELAAAIVAEWNEVAGDIDPRAMPLSGLANASIDRVAPDAASFAAGLARYAESDLLCYRAADPPPLVERQAAAWDPLLDWARHRYDIGFVTAEGIIHRAQPDATIARLGEAVAALDPFTLAALSKIVTIGGSLVIALALLEGEITPDDAFDTAHLDELWQAEQWGEDDLATDARENHRADFLAAARFLALLRG